MNAGAKWASKAPEFRKKLQELQADGLRAAASVVQNEVKRRLKGGFTSGAFFRGFLLNSVVVSEPGFEDDVMVIRVGTNVPYALPWELGHQNLFTRKFERQERWRPAMTDTVAEQREAFNLVVARGLQKFPDARVRV